MTNPNDSAYPSESAIFGGLTKMELIAKDFMVAMIANAAILEVVTSEDIKGDTFSQRAAKTSINWAKALINELNSEQQNGK